MGPKGSILIFADKDNQLMQPVTCPFGTVNALKVIAQRLNIKDWDFNKNPCNEEWNNFGRQYIRRYFVCNCSTVCHITTM